MVGSIAEMLGIFMNNITFGERLAYAERFKKLKVSIHTGKRPESVSDSDGYSLGG